MSNKIRTKKPYNKQKAVDRFFSTVRLWSWESMIDDKKLQVSHGEVRVGHVWKPLSQKQVTELTLKPKNWSICCRALCRSKDGEEVWLQNSLKSVKAVKINDLSDAYGEMRKDVMGALKEDGDIDSVIDCGWILRSFSNDDPIDKGFETEHMGQVTENRHKLWMYSQEKDDAGT